MGKVIKEITDATSLVLTTICGGISVTSNSLAARCAKAQSPPGLRGVERMMALTLTVQNSEERRSQDFRFGGVNVDKLL